MGQINKGVVLVKTEIDIKKDSDSGDSFYALMKVFSSSSSSFFCSNDFIYFKKRKKLKI